ncbi:MAG: L-threonylcarbamoyladenylate synthase [Holosporales bacterium]
MTSGPSFDVQLAPDAVCRQAARLLQEGQVVAIPTETVYGLAARADQDQAVAAIYALKNRPSFNPLIIHCADLQQAETLAEFDARARTVAETFWPGPLTLILPHKKTANISKLATAGLSTVGIRIPAHPLARTIIRESGLPLAAPSANPSEAISPTTAEHVRKGFSDVPGPALIVDGGPCPHGLESTIVDLSDQVPLLLRPGSITPEQLIPLLGNLETAEILKTIKAPGQMKRHYAPKQTHVRLDAHQVTANEALLAFGPTPLQGAKYTLNLSPTGDLQEAAAHLFEYLHLLDRPDFEAIAVMPIPQEGLGLAIHDRLRRAAAPRA